MDKNIKNVLMFLVLILIIVKISLSDESEFSQYVMDTDDLYSYETLSMYDSSKIMNVLLDLPGNDYLDDISIDSNEILVSYSFSEEEARNISEFNEFTKLENLKRASLYNATALFIIVEDVETLVFEVNNDQRYTFTFERSLLEAVYNNDLRNYKESFNAWEEINEQIIHSTEMIDGFYEVHDVMLINK